MPHREMLDSGWDTCLGDLPGEHVDLDLLGKTLGSFPWAVSVKGLAGRGEEWT